MLPLDFVPPLSEHFLLNFLKIQKVRPECGNVPFVGSLIHFFDTMMGRFPFILNICSVENTEVVLISFLALYVTMCARFYRFLRHFYCCGIVFIVLATF